jgi:hypothetical protein
VCRGIPGAEDAMDVLRAKERRALPPLPVLRERVGVRVVRSAEY